MKIISKYKDYYDYLQGIYGVDEKLVLDRRDFNNIKIFSTDNIRIRVIIGDICCDVLCYKGQFYVGEKDFIKIGCKKVEKSDSAGWYVTTKNIYEEGIVKYSFYSLFKDVNYIYTVRTIPYKIDRNNFSVRLDNKIVKLSDDVAIYIICDSKLYKYPILQELGIQKILSAHDAWVELSAYLGKIITKNEPNVPIGNDNVRIVSAGFDLKTSFRNIK